MQLLFEFLPIALFFVTYKFSDLFVATGVLMVAVVAQGAIQWARTRKLGFMMLTSAVLALVFGGLTLAFKDATFIKLKPTILSWLFAGAFFLSQFVGERPLIERVMGESIQLDRALWRRVNLVWAAFFLAVGALNLYVARQFSEETWVSFKAYGWTSLMLGFSLLQGIWLAGKLPDESAAQTKSRAEGEP